jgi:hypothetical protein
MFSIMLGRRLLKQLAAIIIQSSKWLCRLRLRVGGDFCAVMDLRASAKLR